MFKRVRNAKQYVIDYLLRGWNMHLDGNENLLIYNILQFKQINDIQRSAIYIGGREGRERVLWCSSAWLPGDNVRLENWPLLQIV
jgi:hypothetical protein